MHTTHLRKVGGSIMLAVPPSILDLLHLKAGASVGVSVDDGCLIVAPQKRIHYSLAELLSQCDASAPLSAEDREWLTAPTVGDEWL